MQIIINSFADFGLVRDSSRPLVAVLGRKQEHLAHVLNDVRMDLPIRRTKFDTHPFGVQATLEQWEWIDLAIQTCPPFSHPSAPAAPKIEQATPQTKQTALGLAPLNLNPTLVEEFVASVDVKALDLGKTKQVLLSGVIWEDGRSADIVQVRTFLLQSGIAHALGPAYARALINSQEFKNLDRQTKLRLFLLADYHDNRDQYIGQLLLRLLEEQGYAELLSSAKQKCPAQHDNLPVYDGDTKNLGFMTRDNGAFGSLSLCDNHGEESFGEERCYYDD